MSQIGAPPGAWPPARQLALRFVRPLEHFLHVESASGLVLLAAAAAGLVWANSPWRGSYQALWQTSIGVHLGPLGASQSLHFWVNEGLMTLFFFVAGLEIRRELHQGELSELRRAVLPVAAAAGGMLVPALIYLALTRGLPAARGWGVPMATDIAFASGVLALLGKRVPAALRVLLLALAIIDDIGAILVIALFYSSGVQLSGLLLAAAGVALVWSMQRLGVRAPTAYVAPGVVLWAGLLRAGVHPTIAGVVLGLLTPVRAWFGVEGFVEKASEALERFRQRARGRAETTTLAEPLSELDQAGREVLSPVTRLETALHPWVAFGVMPLFALANAGVDVSKASLGAGEAATVAAGAGLGLLLGKPIGVVLGSWLAVRAGATLPRNVGWKGILLVGCVAGIGFTMAIFIAGLAFPGSPHEGTATLAVLAASAVAALVAVTFGRLSLPSPGREPQTTLEQAEASAEL